MESDKHFYEIFEINPQWIFLLTGRPSPGACRFSSLAVKAIERHCDGVLVPDDADQPVIVVEFQMHVDKEIYNRIVVEMALIKGEHPERKVEGLIIFGSRQIDVQTEPWCQIVSVHYLDELLEQFAQRWPTHPLVAVFQPLMEPDRDVLENRVSEYYNLIKTNSSDQRQQEKLLSVFRDWLLQRFAERGLQEIETMLIGNLPHLRDTQAGKDLIAIGVEQGIEIGIEKGTLVGTIQTCQRFLGLPPTERIALETKAIDELRQQAEQLQAAVASRLGT